MAAKGKLPEQFATMFGLAVRLAKHTEAEALLLWVTKPGTDWESLTTLAGELQILIAADEDDHVEGAGDHGLDVVTVNNIEMPVFEKLRQALLQSIADEILAPGAGVIAIYSGFEPGAVDSVSYIRLDEHLGRLTARDLRNLRTRVPFETLKLVLDLAVEIGREGREGKPVGSLFIVGDSRNVANFCRSSGFDPVKGYTRKERSLRDSRVREGIKEIAQLDGAFIVSSDATVESSCQLVGADAPEVTLSHGLGARHLAAAGITKVTSAVAFTVSESNGTIRIFQDGAVVLRVEPFRRAMKWKAE
jgi:DNA integrity scanning protein DisA with diadenylate cyclase activity